MAERTMLRLGDFDFEIATAAYQKYIAHHSARWAEQERIGRDPALQSLMSRIRVRSLPTTARPANWSFPWRSSSTGQIQREPLQATSAQ